MDERFFSDSEPVTISGTSMNRASIRLSVSFRDKQKFKHTIFFVLPTDQQMKSDSVLTEG